jgi:hypothetical protein
MSGVPTRTPLTVPVLITAGLLAARIAAVAPLSDPLQTAGTIAGTSTHGVHLTAPWLYVVLAPLFSVWDGISMLGMGRLKGLLIGCAVLYGFWRVVRGMRRDTSGLREARTFAAALIGFVSFVTAGALWHRPMLALAGAGPDDIVVDYHSHTNASHDVRHTAMRHFDVAANRRWHARAGFDAVFITDHNLIHEPPADAAERPIACPGTEVSAWDAHIVLLGPTPAVPRDVYAASLDGLLTLLRTSDSAYGALSIASLPEYERHHWRRLDLLATSGLDGFEIVNAAPKANELTRARRDSVVALARHYNRAVVGVSDSHGWGATSMVWNLVDLPGWRGRWRNQPAAVCAAIVDRLRSGIAGNRVLERHRLRAEAWWPRWLTPIGVVWETWRGMGWVLTLSWLVWTWTGYLAVAFLLRNSDASLPLSRHGLRRARPDRHQR